MQIIIFIENFFKFFEDTSAEIAIAALIYIERLLEAAENMSGKSAKITETNAKGILHTAMTLASKFQIDRYEKNTIFFRASL
jgi:hypothetical protein